MTPAEQAGAGSGRREVAAAPGSDSDSGEASEGRSFFGRFAERASDFVSRGVFFAACVLVVLIWLPTFPLFADVEAWQLPINTLTTIVTFLLVALLQTHSAAARRRSSTSSTRWRTASPT